MKPVSASQLVLTYSRGNHRRLGQSATKNESTRPSHPNPWVRYQRLPFGKVEAATSVVKAAIAKRDEKMVVASIGV